jgi:hypothetical protein
VDQLCYEWPDKNLDDLWLYQPYKHPFDESECLVALPSCQNPSIIMANYHDNTYNVILNQAEFDNHLADMLAGICKGQYHVHEILVEFFPTHISNQ